MNNNESLDAGVTAMAKALADKARALRAANPARLDPFVSFPRVTVNLVHTPDAATIDEDDYSSNDHVAVVDWSPEDQGDNVALEIIEQARHAHPGAPDRISALMSIESAIALRDALTAIIDVAQAGR